MTSDIIITVIFMIPVYGFLIWSYNCPEDSILFGRRWMYREEPELSSNFIRYTKFASISAMVGIPFVLTSIFLKPYVFGLAVIVFIFVFIIGAFLIFSSESKS
ncbi:hypothetical protein [Neobacillus sp. YIM B06451]|uniref:hypothetical protein n=1 Tax=Neobacillus sp. YIM B06451 TaxID=3070994 RepID=UPI00292F2579|nr:hypothetical protein [Neobacillus sp. YIM B06451]